MRSIFSGRVRKEDKRRRKEKKMKKVLNALGGGTKGLEEVSAAEVASGTYLSVEEVTALMEAFKAKGNSKGEPLALKPFLKVVEEVNRTYHQPLLNHDEAQLTFHLLDTNHDGKGTPTSIFLFSFLFNMYSI
jgi:hypothetical protein